MPNWTTNYVYIEGPERDIAKLKALLQSPKNVFDFNNIIPMPEILKNTASGYRSFEVNGETIKLKAWYCKHDVNRPFTTEEQRELKKLGYDNWYAWAIDNWGTKWNACDAELVNFGPRVLQYQFNTAWSAPGPVCDKLRDMFPALDIKWNYRDEDDMGLSL